MRSRRSTASREIDWIAVGVIGRARAGCCRRRRCRARTAGSGTSADRYIENIFARRDVDRKIGPFRGGDFSKAAVEQGLVGRDELQNTGMARLEIALD